MASVDYFLKLDTIDGESQDSKHKGEIDILSWSWSEAQTGTGGTGMGSGAGKVAMMDVQFTKYVDKASPKLMLACANGTHLPTGTLVIRKSGKDQQEYIKVKYEEVLVSSYSVSGAAGDGSMVPTEAISLNFSKITFDYKPQKADGTLDAAITAGWNVKQNIKI
jgi:type VI secretion system secreted protein Hcp